MYHFISHRQDIQLTYCILWDVGEVQSCNVADAATSGNLSTCRCSFARNKTRKRGRPGTEATLTCSYKYKNEVGCRDDTVPKIQEDTARRSESMQQSSTTPKNQDVGIGLLHALTVSSCIYSFWHGVIPAFLMIFILVSYPGLAWTVSARRDVTQILVRTYVQRFKGSFSRDR